MNPIIPTVFAADPAARVWADDSRIWLYTSHDVPGTNTHDTMVSYHVFSSDDLVHWTDYGVALHLDNVHWAISHMWAVDCIYWRDQYYLVYCAMEIGTRWFRTGLAVSDLPQGPFRDIGFIKNIHNGQDPAVLIDHGIPYLYWGYGKQMFACELETDLLSAKEETIVDLTDQLTWAYEGPWLHTYKGKYYLSYPGLYEGKWPEQMYYAIADKPLGPYTYQGCYIPEFKGCAGTNHGSITEFKGRWYAFHHSSWVSSNGVCRSLMCDELFYNEDGTIRTIIPSPAGPSVSGGAPGPSKVTLLLQAENGKDACGKLLGTRISRDVPEYTGRGYVTGFDVAYSGVEVFAQQGVAARYRLKIRYRAPDGDRNNYLLVNATRYDDPAYDGPERYDKLMRFPQTDAWQELDAGVIQLDCGDNRIRLYACDGGIDVDYFKLEPCE
jgi:hypothetical protein